MSTPVKREQFKKVNTSHTIGDVERNTGVRINAPANTQLTKYFSDNGVPGLARIIEKLDAKPVR